MSRAAFPEQPSSGVGPAVTPSLGLLAHGPAGMKSKLTQHVKEGVQVKQESWSGTDRCLRTR